MIEFAIVVVLLITLLYGLITYGLILAAQSTITQAAADAARAGIVATSTASATAVAQAGTDVGWMNRGGCSTQIEDGVTVASGSGPITCTSTKAACPSPNNLNTCLTVTVSYNYSSSPLFPELPGLGLVTPSTLSSTNVLQISTPSGS